MTDGIWGAVVAVASAMAFLAYYHPNQYKWFSGCALTVLVIGMLLGTLVQRVEEQHVRAIMASKLEPAQKEMAVRAIQDLANNPPMWVTYLIHYGLLYASALGALPWFGLTAQQRDSARARNR